MKGPCVLPDTDIDEQNTSGFPIPCFKRLIRLNIDVTYLTCRQIVGHRNV